jgi:hypothetical protein
MHGVRACSRLWGYISCTSMFKCIEATPLAKDQTWVTAPVEQLINHKGDPHLMCDCLFGTVSIRIFSLIYFFCC